MINVFLLLGSNLGDRHVYLQKAIEMISAEVSPVTKTSSVYETQSWGKTDEPDYLNQVVEVQTHIPARNLLEKVLAIELEMGRIREVKWGSRVIDIDVLFYGDAIINEVGLTIPHPQLHNRRFTLEPLGELAPGFIHPVFKKSVLQLKNDLKDNLIVKKLYF